MPLPGPVGLYDPQNEHDACGLGFVVDLKGGPSHRTVEMGLEILRRLAHRGAAGCDPSTGDGAGILVQIPHRYYERVLYHEGKELPLAGDYGVAQCFLSRDDDQARAADEDARRTSSVTTTRRSSAGATCPSTSASSARSRARRCR